MKTLKIKLIALAVLMTAFTRISFSQGGTSTTPFLADALRIVGTSSYLDSVGVTLTNEFMFDTANVNNVNNRADLVWVTNFTVNTGQIHSYETYSALRKNTSNVNFVFYNTFFSELQNSDNVNFMRGAAFAQLNVSSSAKDLVISKEDTLFVFRNDHNNGYIDGILDYIVGANSYYVTKGVLDQSDGYEDVIFADAGTNLKIYRSNTDGTLDHNSPITIGTWGEIPKKIICAQIDFPIEPYNKIIAP